jgi:hypothetical protein
MSTSSRPTGRRFRVRAVVTRALFAAALLVALLPSQVQAAPVRDPERDSTALTGWAWYHGVTAAQLNGFVSAGGLRIIDLEVESASPLTFSAALVKNSGTYLRSWWWYYGLTASQVSSYLSANSARLIDVERYITASGARYAVAMVANTGVAAKAWWWYIGVSVSQINSYLSTNSARLIDIESYGTGTYVVVMIRNTGVDASGWWWYLNVTGAQVSSYLSANHARLLDIDRLSTGRFNVIMKPTSGEYWWWYYGQSASSLANLAAQNGARIYDLEPYFISGRKYFAAILINDVNAETTRLREIMRPALAGGSYGIYLKRVGGAVAVNLKEGTIFEPASSMKVVHHLYAMRRIASGAEHLDAPADFIWYHYVPTDGPGVCPDPADETPANRVTSTMRYGLTQMMQASDNRTTRGYQLRYGHATLNAFVTSIGMANTELRQIIGCGFNNGLRNDLTLVDAGKLYEGVANGSLLSGANRTTFYEIMLGGPIGSSSALATIVRQEASSLGMTTAEANSFIANTWTRTKGGSYDVCNPGACNPPYQYIRTAAGVISMPAKTAGGAFSHRLYVYGRFVEKLTMNCRFQNPGESAAAYGAVCPKWKTANEAYTKAGNEVFRAQIRAALATWP